MRTWTFDDVRPPGVGPWNDEPDKAQWVDEATDLDCLAVRHRFGGNWCGYVGVPKGHPLFGVPWGDDSRVNNLDAHHGINYSNFCQEGAEDGPGICHVPEPGRPAEVWWFGFDCGHALDYCPTREARLAEIMGPEYRSTEERLPESYRSRYRTFEYVQNEIRSLARQLAEVAS